MWGKQQQHSQEVQEELLLANLRTFQLIKALGKLKTYQSLTYPDTVPLPIYLVDGFSGKVVLFVPKEYLKF